MAGPVLIIEDEPDIAEMLRYSLQREGFETRVVHTGEEGIRVGVVCAGSRRYHRSGKKCREAIL